MGNDANKLDKLIVYKSPFIGSQIAYIGSPLVVPTWAILNILASLVFWVYIVASSLYYTNIWFTGYLPLQSNSVFDNLGSVYNASRVIDKDQGFAFNSTKYEEYCQVCLSRFPLLLGLSH